MSLSALESTINGAFDARDGVSTSTRGEVREAVDHALEFWTRVRPALPSKAPTASGRSING